MKTIKEIVFVLVMTGSVLTTGFVFGIGYQQKQGCTEQCKVKELQEQKEIEEYKWRRSLILEKR